MSGVSPLILAASTEAPEEERRVIISGVLEWVFVIVVVLLYLCVFPLLWHSRVVHRPHPWERGCRADVGALIDQVFSYLQVASLKGGNIPLYFPCFGGKYRTRVLPVLRPREPSARQRERWRQSQERKKIFKRKIMRKYALVLYTGERQISEKKSLTSQISDKHHNRQNSDRKSECLQFSDTHRKGENLTPLSIETVTPTLTTALHPLSLGQVCR